MMNTNLHDDTLAKVATQGLHCTQIGVIEQDRDAHQMAQHDSQKQQVTPLAANLGLARPPAIYLPAILTGLALHFDWPIPFVPRLAMPFGAVIAGSCRHALHLVDQNIPLNGHASAWESTHRRHRQGRAVPLQSQPHLSCVLVVSNWNRARGQRRLDLGHAAPGDFRDVVCRHTTRGALSRSALR